MKVDQEYINDTAEFHRAEGNRDFMLARLRGVRNALLQETDIYALADITMTDEMKTYRQALRDLPANTSDIYRPVFPTKP